MKPSEKNRIILESMMKMASELNMKVIAKKVETKTQMNLLQSIGCTFWLIWSCFWVF